jgi:hypothetical protein
MTKVERFPVNPGRGEVFNNWLTAAKFENLRIKKRCRSNLILEEQLKTEF